MCTCLMKGVIEFLNGFILILVFLMQIVLDPFRRRVVSLNDSMCPSEYCLIPSCLIILCHQKEYRAHFLALFKCI